jgi:Concanavalin A-like lectin/glucanases superfamily/Secretion system C-terminal sorting domain
MPNNIDVTFEIEENFDNGGWTSIATAVSDTFLLKTVTSDGLYQYRVRAEVDGDIYADLYSGYMNVPVGESTYLNFDGDDSFFINDISTNDLDVDNSWTFEAWVNADTYTSDGWNVIMDRQTVFSMYLLDDADADFAIRFVARDESGNITASLNSEASSVNLELGQWFHVAASFDGTTARLFLNGNIVDEIDDANFILTNSTNAFNVGARYWGSYSRYFDGKIDEIRISDIARYTEDFCPSRFTSFSDDENTRLLLHLDDYTGTTIYDETHNFLGITYRADPNDPNWAKSSTPIILEEALSQSLCSGDAQFDIISYNNTTSQWQLSTTGDFSDLSDGGVYTGATTNNLNISDISSLSGQLFYRCIIRNDNAFACSENAYLNVLDNCTVWNGTTWSNGEPTNSLSAIIDANYTTSSDLEAANIVVNENDTLFIMPDNTFSTSYIENNGVIVLKADFASDFSGALITGDILNYGDMIAEKLILAPNLEQEFNQNIINSPLDASFPINQVWSYNLLFLQNNSSPNSWIEANYEGSLSNTTAYLAQAISPEIINFNGTFNTGETIFSIQQGWNLIYNPYSSPIDWDNIEGWTKQGVSDDIYFLDPNNNGNSQNFSVYNGTVNTFSANQYINSMQGFFIYANDENSILSINDNAKVKNSDVQDNDYSLTNILEFEFENSVNEIDEAIIYFSDNDNDSYKIEPLSDEKTYTYILSNQIKYGIASIIQDTPDTTITVGFKSSEAGTCTFRVTEFDFSVPIVLKDLLSGEVTTLVANAEYQFSASGNEPLNRFRIYFGNYVSNLTEIDNSIEIYSFDNTLNIFSNSLSTVNIYNVLGQTILTTTFKNHEQINSLKTGIYIVEIFNKNEYKTQKIIINN